MDAAKLNSEYIEIVKSGENNYLEDYKKTVEAVANSNAIYQGEPVPFLYQPMFFTMDDINVFEEIGRKLISITNKLVKKYKESPEFRKKFNYSKLLEELILIDHGYDISVPMGRFDIFYGGGEEYKFCEFNTDGSSAMNEDNTLSRILLETEPMKKMKEKYEISYFELIYKWVDESIKTYKKFNSEIEKPSVAIVDFVESGTPAEFEEFKKAYLATGCKAVIADPRELKYENGKLYFEDMEIDMIYRRIVTKELIERSNEIQDFINAYRDRAVCIIGPICSQIMHNKIIFKILHDKDTQELLDEKEIEFIKTHIPYTQELNGDRNVYEEVLNNKDKYIIKPKDLYASRGVYAGRDFNKKQWKDKLDKCWGNEYLYQEFVVPYTRDFIEYENDELKINKFGNVVGIFLYNEKFAGLYTRIGKSNIISGIHGYYSVPNLLVK